MSDSTNGEATDFFRLPPEIRHMVLVHYFDGIKVMWQRQAPLKRAEQDTTKTPEPLPILISNKGLRQEAMPLFFAQSTFDVRGISITSLRLRSKYSPDLAHLQKVIVNDETSREIGPFSFKATSNRAAERWEMIVSKFPALKELDLDVHFHYFNIVGRQQPFQHTISYFAYQNKIGIKVKLRAEGTVQHCDASRVRWTWRMKFELGPDGRFVLQDDVLEGDSNIRCRQPPALIPKHIYLEGTSGVLSKLVLTDSDITVFQADGDAF